MSLTRRIAHNTIIQIAGKVISTAMGIFVVGLLTRYLGADGYGRYTTVIAFLQVFAVILDLGLYIILIKKISEPNSDTSKFVNNIFTLRLLSAIIFLGIAPVVAFFFPYPFIVKIGIALTTLSYLFISLNQVLTGLFQKNLKMVKITIAEIVGRIVLLTATGIVLYLKMDLLAILGAVILGSLSNFLYVFFAARQYVKIRLTFEWPVWLQVLKESWPIGLSVAFNLVYFKADTIILSIYQPASDVGIYGATYKVLEILSTLPAMFAGLIMPLLTAAYAVRNFDRFRQIIQKSVNFLFILALPLIIGTQFIAEQLMVLVAGGEFVGSGAVLRILIVATGIIFIGALFGNAVVSINKQKPMILAYLIVAIVSLAGYIILIPRYSFYGAAYMTIASEFLIMLTSFYMVYRTTKARLNFNIMGRALLASLFMTIILWFTRDLHWVLLVFIGILSYASSLYLLKGVTKNDITEILSLSK
ncbi:flippase [Patescibacteria group bacterium]|nr:flippase [Patescibacteria group bacterium]MBU1890017.1 flippase [Patescibacteria group bacterium]